MLFRLAKMIIAKRLKKDYSLYLGYQANMAMCIYDNRRKDGRLNKEECNIVAKKLIELIFGD